MPFDREAIPSAGATENYYDVLGLRPGATDEEIEAAYADLAAMFAPGKVPAARQDYARKQRARLAAAYAVLADPDQRAAYDSRLGGASPLTVAPPAPLAKPPAPTEEAEAPVPRAPGAVEEPLAADIPAPEQPDATEIAAPEETVAADLPAPGLDEPPPASTLTIAPEPSAAPVGDSPAAADGELVAAPVVNRQAAEQETERLPEIEAEESAPVADVEEEEEPDTAEASAPAPDEDLAPWQTPPAAPAPIRAAARPAPARPAPKPRPAAAPTPPPAPRPGGVALPNRREAAQIAARKPGAPAPASPAPPARPGAPAARSASTATRPAPARPAATRRLMTDDGEEELLAPRSRAARPAPPPPRKRKRNTTNRFAYQVMTLVIALVLIVGTAASFLSTTITPAVLDTPTPSAGAAAPLVAAGDSAGQAGQWSQAEQYFQQALQIDPQNVQATLGLAQVYMSKTPPDPQQANAYAQQVIRLAPGSTEATTARNLLAALSLTPQSTATTSGAATTPAAATPPGSAATPATAPTTAATPAP